MPNFLHNLQNKPYETRIKILWVTVSIVTAVLLVIWVLTIKSSVNEVPQENILGSNQTNPLASRSEDVAGVEYIQTTDKELKIFFNITNSTDDILNFSNLENIILTVNEANYKPNQVLDRQQNPFVQKILSHTTNFGILVFEPINGSEGKLTFDQLSYEQSSENIFKDQIELNFEELNQANKLRN